MTSGDVSPFDFGQVAHADAFVNRVKELEKLQLNFRSNIHTMLLSPRRWGKTTLLARATDTFMKESKSHKALHMDMYNIYSPDEFYKQLSKEVIKATSTKMETLVQMATKYLGNFKPIVKFGDSIHEFELGFEVEIREEDYKKILDLPEKIAKEKNLKIAICIDEFQNCTRFPDHLSFQQRLRSVWQHHQHVSYCLYGSRRSMLIDFFENSSMPFYKFGEVVYLQKIDEKEWLKFIPRQFRKTGREASKEVAQEIVNAANNHPYYVQYLAHIVWQRVGKGKTADVKTVNEAIDELLVHQQHFFLMIMDGLSSKQVNFLRAMMDGVGNFSAQAVLRKYDLGSSANVVRIREALEKKDVIDTMTGVELVDPVLGTWLKRKFFK